MRYEITPKGVTLILDSADDAMALLSSITSACRAVGRLQCTPAIEQTAEGDRASGISVLLPYKDKSWDYTP